MKFDDVLGGGFSDDMANLLEQEDLRLKEQRRVKRVIDDEWSDTGEGTLDEDYYW